MFSIVLGAFRFAPDIRAFRMLVGLRLVHSHRSLLTTPVLRCSGILYVQEVAPPWNAELLPVEITDHYRGVLSEHSALVLGASASEFSKTPICAVYHLEVYEVSRSRHFVLLEVASERRFSSRWLRSVWSGTDATICSVQTRGGYTLLMREAAVRPASISSWPTPMRIFSILLILCFVSIFPRTSWS